MRECLDLFRDSKNQTPILRRDTAPGEGSPAAEAFRRIAEPELWHAYRDGTAGHTPLTFP